MTIRALIFISVVLSLIVSCQSKRQHDRGGTTEAMTVNYDNSPVKSVPKIEEQPVNVAVGPVPLKGQENIIKERKEKAVLAMVLGAGLYRSIAVVPLLKKLKENAVDPIVIMGHGLSAVMAAYYSFGYKPDYIEWKFFKFFNELENEKPFTSKWLKLLDTKLLADLADKNIEDGKITLLLPLWKSEKNKVVFLKRGNLRKALLASVDPYNKLNLLYKPAYTHGVVPLKELKDLGVTKVLSVDYLSSGISWKRGDGFLNGTYQKAASIQNKEKEKLKNNIWLTFPLKEFALDDVSTLSDLVHKSRSYSNEAIELIKKEEKL